MSLVKDTLPQTSLSFPGKVSMDKSGERLFVADTGHHRMLVISKEGIILNAIGGGENFEAGFVDGSFQEARFHSPQGIAIEQEIIYIADTENHAIRQVSDNFQRTTFCFHLIFSSHIMFWILSLIYDSGMQFLTQLQLFMRLLWDKLLNKFMFNMFFQIDLEKGMVTTVAGDGKQGSDKEGGNTGTSQSISSPWDVLIGPPPGLFSIFKM